MNWIIKDRGKGKTTTLIFTSAATGYPIITQTRSQADAIKHRAKELELDIPEPIPFDSEYSIKTTGLRHEKVLVDEAKPLIERALANMLRCPVAAVTLTPNDNIQYDLQ